MNYPIQKIDTYQFIGKHGLKTISKIDEMIMIKINEIIEALNDEYYEEPKD